jgi:outer membrane protein assembly factor BamB
MKRSPRSSLLPALSLCLSAAILPAIFVAAGFLALSPPAFAENDATAKPGGDAGYADPMDWPNWRGPELNGVSREKGLVEKWSPRGKGENVLWKRADLGGRSTPICFRGKLYTILRADPDSEIEGERVVCLDAATGKTLWENVFNVFLSDVPSPRVGWSSVVGDPQTGNVFALGVCGYLQCIAGEPTSVERDGKTVNLKPGQTIWAHSLAEEHGIISAFGGRAAFPVIAGNLVFVSSVFVDWGEKSAPAQRILAFDKRNGQVVWYGDTKPRPEDVSYSMPVPTVINGQAVLVVASGDGSIYGLQPRTGKQLWSYNASARGIQATPLVMNNHVFIGQAEENRDDSTMGAFFAIDATKRGDVTTSGELWRDKLIPVDKCSAIPVDGKIFVLDNGGNGILFDPKTGKMIGSRIKLDTANSASPLFADGKIYLCTLGGIWHTLTVTDAGLKDYKMRLSRSEQGETNASPIVSHGRIYQQLPDALYCIGRPNHDPQADARPALPREAATDTDPTPEFLQVVPAESLLRPGDKQDFDIRLYNKRGQYLRDAKPEEVKLSLQGPGAIDAKGVYVAPTGMKPVATIVKAEFGTLKGAARIRIVPPLNWKFDFNDGQIPVTWIGARARHIPIDYDLLKSLEKKNPLARQLCIYLTSVFVNTNRPSLKFDSNTPQQTWTELLRYLDLIEKATTPQSAKEQLDPLLKLLADEKVISKWAWPNKQGIELTVERGPRKITGNGVLLKISTIPRGARSQSWFGQDDLHDYTIQSDVCGATRNRRLPDVGVIGQRYSMVLMGDSQKIEIRTWPAHDYRMRKTVPFAWKPETWYTMKFQTQNEAGKVVLRGKVWPRSEKEPDKWTLEVTDPSPHPDVHGSPGIFGDAQITEIFYDNILVTKDAR